ncbi:hypothetical protein [Puia dinghuensis]|uniref:Uncharacterized protein n=1 Tax=Puia dinghuensis TaxID=1792502 RepID=A0A8J2UF75_9BACT|nr:hypothetical protein [Puia dinghuensis]GGB08547.1 hypothetical protein GCM10011511_35030 [Puia dinghuensis]
MRRIALLFDRTYIDAQHCFIELASQLAANGYAVDLYMVNNPYNNQPFFENKEIRILPFPVSGFQKAEYWSKLLYSADRRYDAIIATPITGIWLAYRTSRLRKIPYYYLADELVEHMLANSPAKDRKKLETRNYKANRYAAATIALGEERYLVQQQLHKIDYAHDYIVIPNAPAGDAVRLKSHYYRDIFNIEDRKPILLFAGTLNWNLAKKIYEETKTYGERDYHLVFQTRTTGLMGEGLHPFIKFSTTPVPSAMMNYAVSSADIGLALYDRNSVHETNNGFTGGKIGTYLKNQLPLIVGSADNLKHFEDQGVGVFWDGETDFDTIARRAIAEMETCRRNIPAFYRQTLQYEYHFEKLKQHLERSIK